MAHINCPKCKTRLRAPEADTSLVLRCPVCKHKFMMSSETVPAGGEGPSDEHEELDDDLAQEFTAADESLLREFGSGTGLLELTRETYNAALDPARAGEGAPGGLAMMPGADPARQFQIVATALSLANKLVKAHKTDAFRVRRSARLAWGLVAGLVLVGAAALWYGTTLSGSAELERIRGANLTDKLGRAEKLLEDEKARGAAAAAALEGLRKDTKALQADLANAREAQGERKALSADLDKARARVEQLVVELARAKAATQPAPTVAKP